MAGENGGVFAASEASCAAAERILRGGGICRVTDPSGDAWLTAVDVVGPGAWLSWLGPHPGLRLILTSTRARAIGVAMGGRSCAAIRLGSDVSPELVASLAGYPGKLPKLASPQVERATRAERAGIELAKRAGLLPAVMSLPGSTQGIISSVLSVEAASVLEQPSIDLATMERAVEARLPTTHAEGGRLVAFRSNASSLEHLALLIGQPESCDSPLCRLHSECLTGDVFGSMRCDCGEQLDGALNRMAADGHGVLLYLRQEGRGIGLVNKLRAYQLQEKGLDTVDANMHLGFQPDERDFAAAAAMLRLLGIARIRLLTNNPDKIDVLGRHGIEVVERVPLTFAANRHNRSYLETKAQRSGHLLRTIEGGRSAAGGTL
jgi:GTP cyclohydrolase II